MFLKYLNKKKKRNFQEFSFQFKNISNNFFLSLKNEKYFNFQVNESILYNWWETNHYFQPKEHHLNHNNNNNNK